MENRKPKRDREEAMIEQPEVRRNQEMIPSFAFDMRGPLTSLHLISEILHDNPEIEADQRERFLDILIHETRRLARLVDRMEEMNTGICKA